jgi:hypothetical protein
LDKLRWRWQTSVHEYDDRCDYTLKVVFVGGVGTTWIGLAVGAFVPVVVFVIGGFETTWTGLTEGAFVLGLAVGDRVVGFAVDGLAVDGLNVGLPVLGLPVGVRVIGFAVGIGIGVVSFLISSSLRNWIWVMEALPNAVVLPKSRASSLNVSKSNPTTTALKSKTESGLI